MSPTKKPAAKKSAADPFGSPEEGESSTGDDVFSVDLSDSDSGDNFAPAGKYIGRVIDLEKATSKADNPMWVWTFVIQEGEFAGREAKLFTALTPAAMWKLTETVDALGLRGEDNKAEFARADVLNRLAVLILQEQEYEGNVRAQLAKILPHPDGAGTMAPAPGEPS